MRARGTDLVGLAVHIGARVEATAGPGEVWVSRTVRDLVAGSGLRFRARGTRRLKGVPGDSELFTLTDAGDAPVLPSARVPRLRARDRILLVAAQRYRVCSAS
jgi:class 3 adenylate cyclase